jgi:hypothetical protein
MGRIKGQYLLPSLNRAAPGALPILMALESLLLAPTLKSPETSVWAARLDAQREKGLVEATQVLTAKHPGPV